jgi:hypothetical protein
MRGFLVFVGSTALLNGCNATASETPEPGHSLHYQVNYLIEPVPSHGIVHISLELAQTRSLLRHVVFRPGERILEVRGDGQVRRTDTEVTWVPPAEGGKLRWSVDVNHRRDESGYDAWLDDEWGVFRAEDVIPRMATRTAIGAKSETVMRFNLPRRWSVVTEYAGHDGRYPVALPERRFDQPRGWIVIGKLGVRRETIAGSKVAVAGPSGQSLRRMDILALLNWTLPELARIVGELPARITVVTAGSPMWRGGLSAPESLFIHRERPLISENATSTLLHEVMHLALGLSAKTGHDWIVEGLAEYYSLELLGRSGTISPSRYQRAREGLADWADEAEFLCGEESSGATTAFAVTVFVALDAEVRRATQNRSNLDAVVQALDNDFPVGLRELARATEKVIGNPSDVFREMNLPGCRTSGQRLSRTEGPVGNARPILNPP